MSPVSRTVAVFDFDDTLIQGDSLWPFLCFLAGTPRALAALAEGLGLALGDALRDRDKADTRMIVKQTLLRRVLAGKRRVQIAAATAQLYRWQAWNMPVLQELREHHVAGRRIVIASGGLDVYLPELLCGVPYDALICTNTGMEGDTATGSMPDGNCVRARKAERVAAWLEANGPFEESWGYGNYPHDVPMLALLKHRILV